MIAERNKTSSCCGLTDPGGPALKLHMPGGPALKLHMTGRGEDATRMEKRLRCAGRALGLDVQVEWDASEFGAPRVSVANRLLTDHLVSTEKLESLLREHLKREEHRP